MEKKKIWVVGHKHPDTDSICAAIAYANLIGELSFKINDKLFKSQISHLTAGGSLE